MVLVFGSSEGQIGLDRIVAQLIRCALQAHGSPFNQRNVVRHLPRELEILLDKDDRKIRLFLQLL